MVTLSCSVHDCVNNEGGLCGAQYIEITGENVNKKEDTYCINYQPSTFINEVKSMVNTDYVGEIMQVISGYDEPKFHPNVKCKVNSCFYNGNGLCEARSIMISDNTTIQVKRGNCETYISN
ncbi:MAG: DUF1540 domain-containing protein [Clostridium sp.]